MKREFFVVILCLFVSVFAMSILVQGASAESIELKIMHWAPTQHAVHKDLFVPWVKMLEEKSGGRIKGVIYPSQLLGKASDTYETVVSGAADIGFSATAYSPGLFTLNEVVSLPFMYQNIQIGTRAMWEHFEKEPALQAEFREVKVLWLVSSPLLRINTAKVPVRKLEDLKGLKLRTGGGIQTSALKALGAVPVVMASSEVYTALQRGTVDGLTWPWEAVVGYKVYEVTKYHNSTSLWGGKFYTIMNRKKWESLPPDIQKIIESVSGAWGSNFMGTAWQKADMAGKEYLRKLKGQEIIDLSPAEEKRWKKAVKPIWGEWISLAEGKGLPAKRILDEWLRLVEKHSK